MKINTKRAILFFFFLLNLRILAILFATVSIKYPNVQIPSPLISPYISHVTFRYPYNREAFSLPSCEKLFNVPQFSLLLLYISKREKALSDLFVFSIEAIRVGYTHTYKVQISWSAPPVCLFVCSFVSSASLLILPSWEIPFSLVFQNPSSFFIFSLCFIYFARYVFLRFSEYRWLGKGDGFCKFQFQKEIKIRFHEQQTLLVFLFTCVTNVNIKRNKFWKFSAIEIFSGK